jgi:hypothetical protein
MKLIALALAAYTVSASFVNKAALSTSVGPALQPLPLASLYSDISSEAVEAYTR